MKLTNHLYIEFSSLSVDGKMPNIIDLNSDQQADLLIIVMASEGEEARQVLHDAIITSDLLQGMLVSDVITAADKYRQIEGAIYEHVQRFIQGKIDDFNTIMHAKNVVSLTGVRMKRCLNEINAHERKVEIVDFDPSMTAKCEELYFRHEDPEPKQDTVDPMNDAGLSPSDFH